MHFQLGRTCVPARICTATSPDVLYIHVPFLRVTLSFLFISSCAAEKCSKQPVIIFTAYARKFDSLPGKTHQPTSRLRWWRARLRSCRANLRKHWPWYNRFFQCVRYRLRPIRIISINPFITHLKAAGVNRLSTGIQSFDDALLKSMGRYDSYGSGQDRILKD